MVELNKIYQGDTLEILKTFPDEFVDTVITSPPYWGLRDYGVKGQIGLEPTLEEYLEKMFQITAELKRVLKKTGVMFLNHGDCYSGSGKGYGSIDPKYPSARDTRNTIRPNRFKISIPPKCMCLQNYRLILRMVDEQGWILRNIIIWYKPNHMPSSVKDRFTNVYEPVFMLVKSKKYWFDLDAVRVPHKESSIRRNEYGHSGGGPYAVNRQRKAGEFLNPVGKNPGDVWQISTQPFPEAHFATFPEKLVEPMIKAGCPRWICKKCGKARERIVKAEKQIYAEVKTKGKDAYEPHNGEQFYYKMRWNAIYHTVGWTDCGCNAGWRPGIVLDPFMGSGTVAVVAKRLGRNWIGIELNPEYIEMAYKRIKKTVYIPPLFKEET